MYLMCPTAAIEAPPAKRPLRRDAVLAQPPLFVVADAVGSRHRHDHKVAVERIRDCGAVITTVESGTDQFKRILPLFK